MRSENLQHNFFLILCLKIQHFHSFFFLSSLHFQIIPVVINQEQIGPIQYTQTANYSSKGIKERLSRKKTVEEGARFSSWASIKFAYVSTTRSRHRAIGIIVRHNRIRRNELRDWRPNWNVETENCRSFVFRFEIKVKTRGPEKIKIR